MVNHPNPIPGCQETRRLLDIVLCCCYLDLIYQHQGFPLCHNHRGSRDPVGFQSPVKELDTSSATKIRLGQGLDSAVGSIPLGKHVRGVMGDKVLSQCFLNSQGSLNYSRSVHDQSRYLRVLKHAVALCLCCCWGSDVARFLMRSMKHNRTQTLK
jgi:hypothetical protein